MPEEELTLDDIVQKLVEAEKQEYIDKLKELEKRIEALEQVQVTRQEFDHLEKRIEDLQQKSNALKARVDSLEKAQKSVTEVVIRI